MSLTLEGEKVPLLKTSVNASVVDEDATVLLSQQFINPIFQKEGKLQEAVYNFPLQSSSAVYFFKTVFRSEKGDVIKTLVGKAVEKQKAREEYEQAKANGKSAQLLEQDFANSPDVFVVSVGNIPSDAMTVDVEIGYYVALVEEEKGNVKRFLFPAVLAGRYGKMIENGWSKQNVSTKAATFEIEVNISLSEHISMVESPSHRITTKLMVDRVPSKASVSFSVENEVLKDDFVLKIGGSETPNSVILVQDPSTILNDAFLERFGEATIAKLAFRCADPTDDELDVTVDQEFVFVVDRSGSMSGASMENCKKALHLCLSCLPENSHFNICSFGSKHSFLFSESREYSQDSVRVARAHVDAMSANMGGTEILAPLKEIVESKNSKLPKVVFLLTDGSVSNTEKIVQVIKKSHKKSGARLFTCGIGSGVSTHLVEELAKAGGGTATFIAYNEKMNAKLTSQMEQAMNPPFENLEVEMGDLKVCSAKIAWELNTVLPSYCCNGQNLSCFVALENESITDIEDKIAAGEFIEPIQLIGTKKTGQGENEVIVAEINLNQDFYQSECNLVVPALKEQVKLAEDSTKKSVEKRALEICLCANIVSKFTSLVAVEQLPDGEFIKGSEIPTSIQHQNNQHERKNRKEKKDRRSSIYTNTCKKMRQKNKSKPALGGLPGGGFVPSKLPHKFDSADYAPPPAPPRAQPQPARIPRPVKDQGLDDLVSEGAGGNMNTIGQTQDEALTGGSMKAPRTDDEILQALAKLQNINGSYDASSELAGLIGKEDFDEKADNVSFSTAVVIVFMEEKLGALKAEWKLLHRKATTYLKKNAENYQELLKLARKFIS